MPKTAIDCSLESSQEGRFMSNARHVAAALLVMFVVPPGGETALAQGGRAPRVERSAPRTVIPDQSLSEVLETADAVVVARVNRRVSTPFDQRRRVFLRFSRTINGMLSHTFDVFDLSGPTVAANQHLRDSRHGNELVGLSPEQALSRVRILLDKLQQ